MVVAQPADHLGEQVDALARVERAHREDEPRGQPQPRAQRRELGVGGAVGAGAPPRR